MSLTKTLRERFSRWATGQTGPADSNPGGGTDASLLTLKTRDDLLAETSHTTARNAFRAAWKLIKPYWTSEDRRKGFLLLGAVVGLVLGQVGVSVMLNDWRGDFYNVLQGYFSKEHTGLAPFFSQIGRFAGLAAAWTGAAVYNDYLTSMLRIRWREWMTNKLSGDYLEDRTFYRLQSVFRRTDNPDQRIADDPLAFVDKTLSLGKGLLNSSVTLASFAGILWNLSGPLALTLGAHSITIPGYMFWAAAGYAGLGSWLAHKIGHPLSRLQNNQQRFEADHRFALVRIRENAQSIAQYGGEKVERGVLRKRFNNVVTNFLSVMQRQKKLSLFTSGHGQAAVVFPFLMSAPRLMSPSFTLGNLMQTASAYGEVQDSLSWFTGAYKDYTEWQAAADRLSEFTQAMERSKTDLEAKKNPQALPAPAAA